MANEKTEVGVSLATENYVDINYELILDGDSENTEESKENKQPKVLKLFRNLCPQHNTEPLQRAQPNQRQLPTAALRPEKRL